MEIAEGRAHVGRARDLTPWIREQPSLELEASTSRTRTSLLGAGQGLRGPPGPGSDSSKTELENHGAMIRLP